MVAGKSAHGCFSMTIIRQVKILFLLEDSLKRTWRVWRPAWSPDIQGCSLSHKTGNDVSGGLLGRLTFKAVRRVCTGPTGTGGLLGRYDGGRKNVHMARFTSTNQLQGMEIYVLASDDDFLPPKNHPTKRRKQLSLSKNKQNKESVESTASKKIKTTSKNVDEKGNDDDPSLSNESSTSSNSGSSISGSTPQTINSDENCDPVVDSTQDIETTIIDETLETLAKESLVRNEEWIIGGKINVRESLKKWKREKVRPHNDLGYYDIIDLTPESNSDFVNSLSKSEYEEMICYDPPKLPNFDYDEIKALIVKMIKASDFRKAVNENFMSTRGDEDKEFAWDFAYQLANSFDHGNDLLYTNMSERMYREIFLTPVIRSLFRKKSTDLDLFFGEVCLYASAEDADLKKNDAEDRSSGRKIDAVWATKPPKIGKMLKIMLNRIARVYGGDSTIFNLLKLYALQIYDHNAIVYEMTVPYRELYLFREVIRTELPTSQVNLVRMRQCIPKFLLFKEMLCKSLSELREYIMEAGLHTPPEKIKASLFVTEMTYTPPSKKDNNKKEIGKRGGGKK
ncbi:5057_t:CDS:10 [Ambispora leptoticha]|uniref:5057_t:CDS:1 n=1 Tax=Ambispora leptoticha TaxID=144679 RepID=A0A9N9CEQ4_9GLOM|nr:5057_t:CDS:10 [Ambispora leptoticha]